VLDAVINGREGRFIFDSGANVSVVPRGRGIFTHRRGRTFINGEWVRAPVYRVRRVQFGDVEVRARSSLITNTDFTRGIINEGYSGLLGNGIFDGFWVEMSFSRGEIVLHREKPEHFAGASHAPLKMGNGLHSLLYLPIGIDDREFLMLLDTGLPGALFFQNCIVNYRTPEDLRQIFSNSEAGDHYLVRTNSISIMDRAYYDKLIITNSYVAARVYPGNVRFIDMGIMGINFMKHYDFLLDYRELRRGRTTGMYFKPITPPHKRDYGFFSFFTEAPELGIMHFFICITRGLVLTCILADSLAYVTHGLRPGNAITRIDGQPISAFSREELLDPSFFHKVMNFVVLNEHGREEVILRQANNVASASP